MPHRASTLGHMCTDTAAVTTYRMLRAHGWTRRAIDQALAGGDLFRLRRGVYATTGACEPVREAARHGGALSCTAAARHRGLWVLDEDTDTPHVWLHAGAHVHPHDGCRCITHWQHDRTDEDPPPPLRALDAFGVADVPQTLVHILRCGGLEGFFVTFESALHNGLITRAGIAWLRTQVDASARAAMELAQTDAESGLESLVRWRLRGSGLRIRSQVNIAAVGRVDFLIGDRLIIEVDGRLNHDEEGDRHKDRMRDANAAAWGYVTLRFDYAQVVHDWPLVLEAIRAQVEAGNHLRH